MKSYWTSLLAGVPLLVFAAAASAETVAYWRFEEGTVGQPAPPPYQTDWFVDSSGITVYSPSSWVRTFSHTARMAASAAPRSLNSTALKATICARVTNGS